MQAIKQQGFGIGVAEVDSTCVHHVDGGEADAIELTKLLVKVWVRTAVGSEQVVQLFLTCQVELNVVNASAKHVLTTDLSQLAELVNVVDIEGDV